MDSRNEMKLFSKPDWRWVGVSYCMFVVFHLLPSVIMIGLFRGVATPGLDIGTAVWMFFGLALVGAYVGYKSVGVTILEPAISSILYILTLFLSVQGAWGLPIRMYNLPAAVAVILAAFVIVVVSAWIGELVQAKKQKGALR